MRCVYMTGLLVLLLVFFQTLLNEKLAKAICPSSPHQVVIPLRACLTKYYKVFQFSKGVMNVRTFQDYCINDAQAEVDCVQDLIDDCRRTSPGVHRISDKTLNYNGILVAIATICGNLTTLSGAQDCIRKEQPGVSSCWLSSVKELQQKNAQIKTQAISRGIEWAEDELYKELCQYAAALEVCQEPYGKQCGQPVGEIFHRISEAQAPAVCAVESLGASYYNIASSITVFVIALLR